MAGNMGVEKQVEELKKRVEELEREGKAFRGLVLKRERIDVKSEQLRKEWFREANKKYFSKKRVVKKTADDLATNIALGKSVQLDKIKENRAESRSGCCKDTQRCRRRERDASGT